MDKIDTVCILNWGMGARILEELLKYPKINLICVVTDYDLKSNDKFKNETYNLATTNRIEVLKDDENIIAKLEVLFDENKPKLFIVHGFMRKLPNEIFNRVNLNSINIHASLLPKYRGPNPINWILHNKEKKSGVTAHKINEKFDEGSIFAQVEVDVHDTDDFIALLERKKKIITDLVAKLIDNLNNKNFVGIQQNEKKASYYGRYN